MLFLLAEVELQVGCELQRLANCESLHEHVGLHHVVRKVSEGLEVVVNAVGLDLAFELL